jgi:hypothetical protein
MGAGAIGQGERTRFGAAATAVSLVTGADRTGPCVSETRLQAVPASKKQAIAIAVAILPEMALNTLISYSVLEYGASAPSLGQIGIMRDQH